MLGKMIVGWAALGVTLTSATQLRMGGLPFGPGEAFLALWIALFVFCLLGGGRFSYSHAFRPFVLYWAIAAVLLAAGSIVAIVLGVRDPRTASHDALAFAFVAALTCLLAIRLGNQSNEQYYLSLARATFFTISAVGLILLGASLVTSQLGPISLWYYGVRFRGWSENPNQLALFMVAMPFLGWYLLQGTDGLLRKVLYLLAIVVCTVVGLATQSDALRVAWAGAAGAIAVWRWIQLVVTGRGNFLHIAISRFLVPLTVLALAIGAGTEFADYFRGTLLGLYEQDDQGITRVTAWLNGIAAIRHSPLVGLGPGAYSGLTGPFEGFEAHNTLIDWGMSTGLLGVSLLLLLSFWCFRRALHVGAMALLGVTLAVIIDSLFHYGLRQPVYWLVLVLVVTLTEHRAVAPIQGTASKRRQAGEGAPAASSSDPERCLATARPK